MDQFKNRKWVRIIAIADISLSIISVMVLTMIVLWAFFFTSAVQQNVASTGDVQIIQQSSGFLSALWFIVFIMIAAEVAKIVAALKLLKASNVETDPKESLKLCTFWRNVNLFFLVIMLINCFTGFKGTAIVTIILYAVSLYFVHLYMKELLGFEGGPHSQPGAMAANNVELNAPKKFDGGESGPPGFNPGPPPSYSTAVNEHPPQWT